MRQEPIKAYGHLYPASLEAYSAVLTVLQRWNAHQGLELVGDVLQVSYEGVFFPADDMLAALRPFLSPASQGKLDVLSMEDWTLTRHLIGGETTSVSCADLNQVLAYSGH